MGGLAWDPTGRYLLQFDFGLLIRGRVFILNAGSFKSVREHRTHTSNVRSAVFSRDGKLALTASDDKTAQIWNVVTGDVEQTFKGHTKSIRQAVFSRREDQVLTASDDGTAIIWDRATAQPLVTLKSDGKPFSYAAWLGDGQRIVTVSLAGGMSLFNASGGPPLSTVVLHKKGAPSAQISPTGFQLVTGGQDNTVVLTDLATSRTQTIASKLPGVFPKVAFSPNARYIGVSTSRQVTMYSAEDGAPIDSFDVPQQRSSGFFSSMLETGPEFTFAVDSKTLIMGPIPFDAETGASYAGRYVEWRPESF